MVYTKKRAERATGEINTIQKGKAITASRIYGCTQRNGQKFDFERMCNVLPLSFRVLKVRRCLLCVSAMRKAVIVKNDMCEYDANDSYTIGKSPIPWWARPFLMQFKRMDGTTGFEFSQWWGVEYLNAGDRLIKQGRKIKIRRGDKK